MSESEPQRAVRERKPRRDWGPLEGLYRRSLRASSEAIYPANTLGAPSWVEAELEPRMVAYVEGLPPSQRKLLKLMFIGVELLAVVLSPGLRTFSRRSLERRKANVCAWRASRILPVRLLGDALKSSLQMVYMAHPTVSRFIQEFKPWAHPADRFQIEVRPVFEQERG